ncbi:SDR family NAD(P)-dependent oxidoreductase [Jiella endophytica]|uniref:SDR family NAD(P)-dependent oxidoreductase n=1 Tax=Jiella endophytica TaxID=2558362 RepID=A0A4Y8RI09_9HYPH|nr:short-chain dehydrogenase/reductase [Jiella endophytica]TFF22046.1 SDR family NAD(P)-dependent oxidoreductase [Jiella endophytica]
MDLQLAGQRILVTGGSKGIGFAIAELFAAEGADIMIVGRDEARLAAAKDRLATLGTAITAHACDIGDASARKSLIETAGEIDVLVNCAGAIPGGDLFALPIETWQESWQLKVFGYIDMTRLALEGMKARGSGTIVNIIGDLGRSPRFDYVCGSTANAALIAFTEAVGAKSTDWNVRVFGVNPSGTKTDRVVQVARKRAESAMGDPERWPEILANLPFGRLAEPEEIARMVVMLASPLAGYLSGTVVDVDAGLRHRK